MVFVHIHLFCSAPGALRSVDHLMMLLGVKKTVCSCKRTGGVKYLITAKY